MGAAGMKPNPAVLSFLLFLLGLGGGALLGRHYPNECPEVETKPRIYLTGVTIQHDPNVEALHIELKGLNVELNEDGGMRVSTCKDLLTDP